MKTSRKPTLPHGEGASIYSQADFLASHSLLPASEMERAMTVTSGLKCSEQYARYSPLGSLVKTLLGSSRWYSPARRLTWDVRNISSRRITYTEKSNNSQSTPSVKTLSTQDIPSNRLLFRLVPSERPTEEIGCGLLPTPTAIDKGTGRVNKSLSKKATERPTLAKAAKMQLLPTPKTQEARGNCSVNRNKFNLTDKIAELISPISDASQLNPQFVAEMMGFPHDWTLTPFLSQNGEQKA